MFDYSTSNNNFLVLSQGTGSGKPCKNVKKQDIPSSTHPHPCAQTAYSILFAVHGACLCNIKW
jgi:hypothetical protein